MTHRTERCLNCDAPTPGEYCAACGQKNADYRASFREILADAADGLFQLDGRIVRTLWPFIVDPGRLIREYNAGRRARYTSPLRLYLFFSVACFFAITLVSRRAVEEASAPGAASPVKAAATALAEDDDPDVKELAAKVGAAPAVPDVRIRLGGGRVEAHLQRHVDALKKLPPGEAARRLSDGALDMLPRVLFLLVPLFALLLKLLYLRQRVFYVEHLVFALYTHAFVFLLLLLRAALFKENALLLLPPIHLAVAMRGVYGQPWRRTLLKFCVLCAAYTVLLAIGALAALLVAVAMV